MKPDTGRRIILKAAATGAAGFILSPFLSHAAAVPGNKKKILFFTKSQGYPHDVITRKSPDVLSFGEQTFKDYAEKAGYDVVVSKDGTLFDPDKIGQFDVFAFYTTGDLTKAEGEQPKSDKTPPMSVAGKAALLKAIADGKGFLGLHSATDTFHSKNWNAMPVVRPAKIDDNIDPYIEMVGGEFLIHGKTQQFQKATIKVADENFPGLKDFKDFTMTEEWYSQFNLAPDLHVILVQDSPDMRMDNGQPEYMYQRPPYPETWARPHGKGRVFYSSMGHREDVWTSEIFQKVLLAGLAWTSGNVEADVTPNLEKACPEMMKNPTAHAPAAPASTGPIAAP